MRVEMDTDVRALRRIALLVLRAKEDGGPCLPELEEIGEVIERMKRDVALGTPFIGEDLREMASLVGGLPCDTDDHGRVHRVVVGELRDLVAQLTP